MTGEPMNGGCQCESLRFELKAMPLFTHACHCFNCRRRSGSAFGMTTIVLRDDLTDVTVCPLCGGTLGVVSDITDPTA